MIMIYQNVGGKFRKISPDLATSDAPGLVRPDNRTVFVDENGVLSAKASGTSMPIIGGDDNFWPGFPFSFTVSGPDNVSEWRAAVVRMDTGEGFFEITLPGTHRGSVSVDVPADVPVASSIEVAVTAVLDNGDLTPESQKIVPGSDEGHVLAPVVTNVTDSGEFIVDSSESLEKTASDANTVVLSAFRSTLPDTHAATHVRVTDYDGNVFWDSGEIDGDELEVLLGNVTGLPERGLILSRFCGDLYGWSAWGMTPYCVAGLAVPTISHAVLLQEGEDGSRTFRVNADEFSVDAVAMSAGIDDSHAASQVRLLNADGSVAYDSGEISGDVTSFEARLDEAPAGALTASVRYRGASMGWTDWSSPEPVIDMYDPDALPNEVLFDTPGTYTWKVPEGVTVARVLVVGGGSGGYSMNFARTAAKGAVGSPGGFGGGIVSAAMFLCEGEAFQVVVGAQGTWGKTPSEGRAAVAGSSGTASSFGSGFSASGGTSSGRGVSSFSLPARSGVKMFDYDDGLPSYSYKSCRTLLNLALNRWSYDTTAEPGTNGSKVMWFDENYSEWVRYYRIAEYRDDGDAAGIGADGRTEPGANGFYGVGGNGGDGLDGARQNTSLTSQVVYCGQIGGAGGFGGGLGGTGGCGGSCEGIGGAKGDPTTYGGQGGDGGDSHAVGGQGGKGGLLYFASGNIGATRSGSGGCGGNAGVAGVGGRGGDGGDVPPGYTGEGGCGQDGGTASFGGDGGRGGDGMPGNASTLSAVAGNGGAGGRGGPGCVVIWY